jgi:hypothetical protein
MQHNLNKDKPYENGHNRGQVFKTRRGRSYVQFTPCTAAKQPNLNLKNNFYVLTHSLSCSPCQF